MAPMVNGKSYIFLEDKSQPLGCENAIGECPVNDMKTHTVGFNQTNFIGLGYLWS